MTTPEPNPHYQNGYTLQHIITRVAPRVELFNESQGLYGELIDPSLVLQGLHTSDHVGKLDDPTAAAASQAVHSFVADDLSQEIVIEFDNATPMPLVLRWVDEKGTCFPHFRWTLEPFSSKVQYSRLGHLFVLSLQQPDGEEQLLGAYRIRMPLPSGSAHYVLVELDPEQEELAFHVDFVLADKTGQDGLMVACASLDPLGVGEKPATLPKTIKTLSTIVGNLQKDPDNAKFRSLRLSNATVQKTIGQSGGARRLLHSIGFREDTTKENLELETELDLPRLQQATALLQQLQQRGQPGLVLELAPSPPWQGPVLNSAASRARGFGSGNGTSFLSDDEKWGRAERNRKRRGRAGRRPDPGNAPSSNGRWGR